MRPNNNNFVDDDDVVVLQIHKYTFFPGTGDEQYFLQNLNTLKTMVVVCLQC